MRRLTYVLGVVTMIISLLNSCNSSKSEEKEFTLQNAFSGKFLIGTALNTAQITGNDIASISIIKKHFNAIVAENCMKSEEIQPQEGKFHFALADSFVNFGVKNNMHITGHVLIWHSQAPEWFFIDENGEDVSRDVLIERMKNHITTLVSRYKGRVKGWDVVNEAILDDGTYRNNKFFEIIGKEYVNLSFEFAHNADPEAELYYNDFNMASPGKRKGVVKMVKELQEEEIRIDGIGMQAHSGLDYPDFNEFEKSIVEYSSTGLNVLITELDLSMLPLPKENIGADVSTKFEYEQDMNPYTEGLPDSVQLAFESRYIDFFRMFLKYQDAISRVTLWGVNDTQNWKNDWPIMGRTDYPLLFDRENKAKPVVEKIVQEALNK